MGKVESGEDYGNSAHDGQGSHVRS